MFDHDVAVVGLGAMGSAALYQLAKAGADVVGLDRFDPPHALGSSHGDTRITRQAVGEGEDYVPFVMRSHAIWRELEQATGETLLTECGTLIVAFGGMGSSHHARRTSWERRSGPPSGSASRTSGSMPPPSALAFRD